MDFAGCYRHQFLGEVRQAYLCLFHSPMTSFTVETVTNTCFCDVGVQTNTSLHTFYLKERGKNIHEEQQLFRIFQTLC